MIVYCIPPIDHWNGWLAPSWGRDHDAWQQAKMLARRLGWEGDVREGPYVTVLPVAEPGPCPVLIAWKQDNNGTTFVASPFVLPWMEYECTEWAKG